MLTRITLCRKTRRAFFGTCCAVALLSAAGRPSAFSEETSKTVSGDFGRTVSFQTPFERVVSLTPSITENLFALGAEGALVGVTQYCDYPPEVRAKKQVGDIIRPNLEAIILLEPDLVLSAGNAQLVLDKASELGISTLSFRSESLSDMKRDFQRLGVLLGKKPKADAIIEHIERTMAKFKAQAAQKGTREKTLLAFDLNPLIAAGQGTLGNELLGLLGCENIALQAQGLYPRLATEFVVEQQPEWFLYAGQGTPREQEAIRAQWACWTSVPAVANGHIHSVSADLVSRPSLRILDGLQVLGGIVLNNNLTDRDPCGE